jgi:hypothetical protein
MHIKVFIAIAGLVIAILPKPEVAAYTPVPTVPLPIIKMVQPIEAVEIPTIQPLEMAPYPIADPGTYSQTYDAGNCTAYVAGRISVPDTWGNANAWDDHAQAEGHTVSSEPIVGAIAQSDGGFYGHVAVVIAIAGDQVQVSEMNVRGLGVVDEAWYPISTFKYIYI